MKRLALLLLAALVVGCGRRPGAGAGLSLAADHPDRAVAGGRRRGCALPRGRAAPVRAARQVGRGREPAGRRLGDRHHRGRQGCARRLHLGDGRQRITRHQRHLYKKLPYDPAKDFEPFCSPPRIPFVLVVNPSLPVRSVAELVKYAKDNPGKLSFASGGAGLAASSLRRIAQEHDRHRDDARSLQGQRAGADRRRSPATCRCCSRIRCPSLPQIREGKVRALGVSTAVRLPSAPEIPPIAESGVPGFRRRRVGHDHGAGRHAEGDREQAPSRAQRRRRYCPRFSSRSSGSA